MPELSQKERLQLSLLDRLADDEPDKKTESREKRVISISKLRQFVQRDLTWLLNTTAASANIDLSNFDEVDSSAFNYGIADMTGYSGAMYNPRKIERELLKCIKNYEPRILPNTLRVNVTVDDKEMSANTVVFEITGELWAQPVPLQLFLKTELDLEDGSVNLSHWS
jgi:type VI secretion system protein ImpF